MEQFRLMSGRLKKGLSDYLGYEETSWNELLITDKKYPNLHTIPVGTIPPNPTELLEDKSLATLIQALRNEYDYILLIVRRLILWQMHR